MTPPQHRHRRRAERGQGLVEYGLIVMLIAIVVLVAVEALGHSTSSLYTNISTAVQSAGS